MPNKNLTFCNKCSYDALGRCIYGCPHEEIYIRGAIGSDIDGITVWSDEEYDNFAKQRRKALYWL